MDIKRLGMQSVYFNADSTQVSNETVGQVQQALNRLHGVAVVSEDGHFDSSTEQAVRQFQQEQNLPQTGVINQELVDALSVATQNLENRTNQSASATSASESELQNRLHEHALEGQLVRMNLGVKLGEEAKVLENVKTSDTGNLQFYKVEPEIAQKMSSISSDEVSSSQLLAVFMKLSSEIESNDPLTYKKLADYTVQIAKSANEKEIEKLLEQTKKTEEAKNWSQIAKIMMETIQLLKGLFKGLSKVQIQQLVKIPMEFGFSEGDSKTIVEGIIGGYTESGNSESVKAAIGLIQSMSEKKQDALMLSLLNTVATMKGYKNLADACGL